MASAIYTGKQYKLGHAYFGKTTTSVESVAQIVHDGDTVKVNLHDNLSVRFLGIDTPEISFELVTNNHAFTYISNEKWNDFFISGNWKKNSPLSKPLLDYLDSIIKNGEGIAPNHAFYAGEARTALMKIIGDDKALCNGTNESFEFFLSFAHEFLDGYGRLLCYLNSDTNNFKNPGLSEEQINAIKYNSYNERQMQVGAAMPYFIWPNIQPFLSIQPFSIEFTAPSNFWALMKSYQSAKLQKARQDVKTARLNQLGIYGNNHATGALILQGFELRYLGRQSVPDRYVIDLNDEGNNKLTVPERYYEIPNAEDRLFIPSEYVPVFRMHGWS